MKFRASILSLPIATVLSACGGSNSGSGTPPPPPPANFAIGGSVSGLTGTGLVLQNNGGDNLTVTANGTFTFATRVTALGAYNVTVLTQPSSPTQICTVSSGNGTASADITTVTVTCVNSYTIGGTVSGLTGTGLVLQDNGADNLAITANGNFTFATPVASGNTYAVTVFAEPSGPAEGCSVTDGGGNANASVANVAVECAASSGEWTWIGGSDTGPQLGIYGSLGVADPANIPGARMSAVRWADTTGNLWLFGGQGYPSSGNQNVLNDLWKYSQGEWTWVGGSDLAGQSGVYGTIGVADPANVPGARDSAVGCIDSTGDLWLFGGTGFDSAGGDGELNDLWKFSSGEWTWVGGSGTKNQSGIYGSMGTGAPDNVPGSRDSAFCWIDLSGNFWLFGGDGFGSAGSSGQLNDLWKYSSGQWTWMGGSEIAGQAGTYGTQGVASPNNTPGARDSGVSATDTAGNFWLFGGRTRDTSDGSQATLNDLWKYSAGQWTWVSGSNALNQLGVYGTKGVADPANVPGARRDAVGFLDATGSFWLFGGDGNWNDLWKYSGGEWTWVSGSSSTSARAVYGTLGLPAADNVPGGRNSGVGWIDENGSLWLFGGSGIDSTGTVVDLNDMWEYTP